MAIKFSTLDERRVILIAIDGALDADQVEEMRRQSVELAGETGITNVVFDLRGLTSLANGDPAAIVDLGNGYKTQNIPFWANTAILMPVDQRAFEQMELLHEIEISRGRGLLEYVESVDEAVAWFEEMDGRVRSSVASGRSA